MDSYYHHTGVALEPGEHRVDFTGRYPGGAGANLAVALARLGLRTATAGAIGSDSDGQTLVHALQDSKVNAEFVLRLTARDAPSTGHANIYVGRQHTSTLLTYPGANEQFGTELQRHGQYENLVYELRRSRVVHISPVAGLAELQLHDKIIRSLPNDTVVSIKPGTLHGRYGPGQLSTIINRANLMVLTEDELDRLLVDSPVLARRPSGPRTPWEKLNTLFEQRFARGSREPLIIVLTSPWQPDPDDHGLGNVYVGWGLREFEDGIKDDGVPTSAADVLDITGTSAAIRAGVVFGLFRSRLPLDSANLAYVLAMSVAARYGYRDGLPSDADIGRHWRRWLGTDESPDWLRRQSTHDAAPVEPLRDSAGDVDTYGFTERELDVIPLLKRGLTNRQIAEELVIAVGTASVHVSHILRKLGVTSRGQAIALLLQDRPIHDDQEGDDTRT